jgi:hypothetical protein
VPEKPTPEMLAAADREHAALKLISIALISYKAMLAAAPQPPVQQRRPIPSSELARLSIQRTGLSHKRAEGYRDGWRDAERHHGITGDEE